MRQIERFSNPVNARVEERRNQQLAQQAQVLMEKANRTLSSGVRKKLPIEDYRYLPRPRCTLVKRVSRNKFFFF
jgi:hypothetical protein